MLRPQVNAFRDVLSLDGVWRLTPDPEGVGDDSGWRHGAPARWPVAVPGSWNEQLAERGLMNFDGVCWYERDVIAPSWCGGRRLVLRFGSVDYSATVFVNGAEVGRSGPPMLPFALDVTDRVSPGERFRLVVRVDGRLPAHAPMQRVEKADYVRERRIKDEYLPAVRFDFFPYAGINRSVSLCAEPRAGLDLISVETRLEGADGLVTVRATTRGAARVRVSIADAAVATGAAGEALTLRLADVRPWDVGAPNLYTLIVEAIDGGAATDRYELRIGVREIGVSAQGLTVNGRPVTLKGFGKHEEGPIRGRGTDLAQIVKDMSLLDWCGANSFRTSHYPYSEEWLDAADEAGILVISELFSVNLDFRRIDEAGLDAHKATLAAQIARDGLHPCVVAWSLSNEPGYLGEAEASGPVAAAYWKALYAEARRLDPTRPLTHANVSYAGEDAAFEFDDFLSLNRYYGWYQSPAQLDEAEALLEAELNRLSSRYGKPILLTEFGADAAPGFHATGDQLFTEEYQSALIERYWRVIERHPAVFGGHVWAFVDFRTAQHSRRVVFNFKGVFTRGREPKRAAWTLREVWRDG